MKAVLFDLDDTVLDTIEPRMAALAHTHETLLGRRVDPYALWAGNRGATIEVLGRRLVGDRYRTFVDMYREHYFRSERPVAPYAGIETVLHALHESDIPAAVVTAKVSWAATAELDRSGLLRYFAAVVGFEDTDLHKPDPEPVFAAMERLLVDEPGEVAMVGDSPADIAAANAAGCISIGATWGCLDADLLQEAAPDHLAASPADLFRLLGLATKEITA